MDVKKNDLLIMKITDMGNEGEGIGKAAGYTLFVKDAIIGDEIEVRVTKLKKNYGYGRLEKVLAPSPFRVKPLCPYHKQCGGCQIQALSYDKQLEFKESKVKNNLVRIGGFERDYIDSIMEPIIGMDHPYRYRNKAQYPFGTDREGNIVAGFYAGRTHSIIPNTNCYLGAEVNEKILLLILEYMKGQGLTAYDETTGKGLLRHVLIRMGFVTNEIMVCLVINGEKLPHADMLVEALRTIDGMTSISISTNMERTNVIMGERISLLWGQAYITDYLGDISFRISPLSFYQVNPVQTKRLYETALEYASLTGSETVWDLYCGIGTISLFLAGKAGKVYGVEVIPQAIEDAGKNAEINHIENVEFYVGRAEELLPRMYEEEDINADVIVVDPPRKGCDSICLDTILKIGPERVVYISCDSATLARDLQILAAGGYSLKRVRAVDQFSQTGHVETVVLLVRIA